MGIGIIRRVDNVGRIVLPSEIRKILKINIADIEFYVDRDTVILKKYVPKCSLCKANGDLNEFKARLVCKKCIQKIEDKIPEGWEDRNGKSDME